MKHFFEKLWKDFTLPFSIHKAHISNAKKDGIKLKWWQKINPVTYIVLSGILGTVIGFLIMNWLITNGIVSGAFCN